MMMYIRFVVIKVIEALAYFIGLLIYPLCYLQRGIGGGVFYWWANNTEGAYLNNWWGDDGYQLRCGFDFDRATWLGKFIQSYRWNALRNPHFNLKHILTSWVKGEKTQVKILVNEGPEGVSGLRWRNKAIHGKQFATFKVGKRKHFRYSVTKKLVGRVYYNLMLGSGEFRLISKLRIFKA